MGVELETALSFGDEARGKIVLRGHDLAVLAETEGYEAVAARLWADVVPFAISPEALGVARERMFGAVLPYAPLVAGRPVAEAMRVLLAAAVVGDPVDLVAAVGLAAVLAMRSAQGMDWRAPDAGAGHAEDLLAMATGQAAAPDRAAALERYMTLMIDHGISASTYAARIAASTGAGLVPVALAALSVLEGPKHGGAPALVLDQLDGLSGPGDVLAELGLSAAHDAP